MIGDLKFAFLCQSSSKVLRSKENKLAASSSLENSDELYLPSNYIQHSNMVMAPQTVSNLAETHNHHYQHYHQCGSGHRLSSNELGACSYPDFATLSSGYRNHSRSACYNNNFQCGQSTNKIRSSMNKFASKFITQPADSLPRAFAGQHYSNRYRHQPECARNNQGRSNYHSLNRSSNSIAGVISGAATTSALRSSRGNNGTKQQTRFALNTTLIDDNNHHYHEHRHGRRHHNERAHSNSCSNLVGMPTNANSIPDLTSGVPLRSSINLKHQHGRQDRFAHNQMCSRSFEDDTLVHLA